jgi:hypothetical protein
MMKMKINRNIIATIVLGFLIITLIGCGAERMAVKITYPSIPTNTEVTFVPVSTTMKYVGKNGTNEMTIDNVTVKVDSIVSEIKDNNYSVAIPAPNGNTYEWSIFPMMLVLSITNNTDHIVTLDKTIVRLEDVNQREYPMIMTLSENKRDLIKRVTKAYDDYKGRYIDATCEAYKKMLSGPYIREHENDMKQIKEILDKGVMIEDATKVDTATLNSGERVNMVSKDFFQCLLIREKRPEYEACIYKYFDNNYSVDGLMKKCKNTVAGNIDVEKYKKQAEKKIENEISDSIKGVLLTSGNYPRIDILPGRSVRVVAPFAKRQENEVIERILVGVYDLPTKVDQAANPIKRATFNFDMIAVK